MSITDHQLDRSHPKTFEGWNIGSVSIKRVQLLSNGSIISEIRKHNGEPEKVIREMLSDVQSNGLSGIVVTGPQASTIFTLPYLPESLCIESALRKLNVKPEIVLSLGGETILVYCMSDGTVRNMLSSNRCAAGSGEFLIQQFGRMNLGLEDGIRLAKVGKRVKMASRCSVHCKSDATHKLNKGECTPADITFSLIADLAARIARQVESSNWPRQYILLAGGITRNELLLKELCSLLPESRIELIPESYYLEAFGAAVAAREAGSKNLGTPGTWLKQKVQMSFSTRPPLKQYQLRVKHIAGDGFTLPTEGVNLILGVDSGSTTTKAILFDRHNLKPVAGCYLRTHGNPILATSECLSEIRKNLGATGLPISSFRIVQASVTGSGRDLVSVYLDNCLSFNEILAHSHAAKTAIPNADTLFEIGGQDAKFVALQSGIPVDYSMNDGCSAGTGSFLEEAASSDMQIPIDKIGPMALDAEHPIAFGERCAAFINSEVRSALQQGAHKADVLAGLVYAITDNYLTRVVGARNIGSTIVLQGGVALNSALAAAMAALTGMEIHVPPHPELMGCIGAAQMAADLLKKGLAEEFNRDLDSFGNIPMRIKKVITCKSCDNHCEIKQIELGEKIYPFGGLCSKWEMKRRPKILQYKEGKDLVKVRNDLMFNTFSTAPPVDPRGRIGLPLALTTYELYPFYTRLLTGMGYEVVLSRPGSGNQRTYAPTCYPGEILHAAVDDLLSQEVDYIFLPYIREFQIPPGHEHAYLCSEVQDAPGVIKTVFEKDASRILTPEIGLADHLTGTTENEICAMALKLGVSGKQAMKALHEALMYQGEFQMRYREIIDKELKENEGPVIVLAGRPYAAFAPEVNLSIPRKITSRGFTVVPADGLPLKPSPNVRDIWYFTQITRSAIEYVHQRNEYYVCAISCFSCSPDAIYHHRLRHDLGSTPFCFLEIDSQTAHAGIETRIGAFLDIIEERCHKIMDVLTPVAPHIVQAQIIKKAGKMHILDSSGNRIGMNDKRVLHVLLADLPHITTQMSISLYGTMGWRSIQTPDTNHEILQKARRVCSGRECLPFLSMTGKVLAHLETRPAGEVTVFHLLDQEGPCQIGNWHDALPMIIDKLGQPDAVVAWPNMKNNYMGGGDKVALFMAASCIAGDLMNEVKSSLRCLAKEPEKAILQHALYENSLLEAAKKGLLSMERELVVISRDLKRIPIHLSPAKAPKVLLFGGINRIFVDKPVRDFFEERGILAKTNDISEFLSLLEFESMNRSGFAHKHLRPEQNYSILRILTDLFNPLLNKGTRRALRARLHCRVIELLEKRWSHIMADSGLLFTHQIPFHKLTQESHDSISWNGWTEAPCTLGRYLCGIKGSSFDGYVNVGAFNCTPANTASAVINVLSKHNSVPYAVIEADGTSITPSQVRQLETIAGQVLQGHKRRNEIPEILNK